MNPRPGKSSNAMMAWDCLLVNKAVMRFAAAAPKELPSAFRRGLKNALDQIGILGRVSAGFFHGIFGFVFCDFFIHDLV